MDCAARAARAAEMGPLSARRAEITKACSFAWAQRPARSSSSRARALRNRPYASAASRSAAASATHTALRRSYYPTAAASPPRLRVNRSVIYPVVASARERDREWLPERGLWGKGGQEAAAGLRLRWRGGEASGRGRGQRSELASASVPEWSSRQDVPCYIIGGPIAAGLGRIDI